jgi:hypothetical protein
MQQVTKKTAKRNKKNRLFEPSTWAGLSGIAAALSSIPAAAPIAIPVAAVFGAVAVYLREQGAGDAE